MNQKTSDIHCTLKINIPILKKLTVWNFSHTNSNHIYMCPYSPTNNLKLHNAALLQISNFRNTCHKKFSLDMLISNFPRKCDQTRIHFVKFYVPSHILGLSCTLLTLLTIISVDYNHLYFSCFYVNNQEMHIIRWSMLYGHASIILDHTCYSLNSHNFSVSITGCTTYDK